MSPPVLFPWSLLFKITGWPDAVAINDPETDPVAPQVLDALQAPGAALLHMVLETEGLPLCSLMVVAHDKEHFSDMVSGYIKRVLNTTNGKIHGPGGAAEVMAINPSTLRSKIGKLGIRYTRKS
jgi:hypothetical protein